MIVLDCEQGSRAWEEARLGIPTASCFARIVTPGGKLSSQRDGYQATSYWPSGCSGRGWLSSTASGLPAARP